MNSDATEAALGLLGLSPLNAPQSHPQPHPHHHVAHTHGPTLTSTSVGIAIDRTSVPHIVQSAFPPSLVPLKRKQPSPAFPPASTSIPHTVPTLITPSTARDNLAVKHLQTSHPLATASSPPIKSTRPLLNNAPTKPSIPPQRPPQQRPFSPSLSTLLPPHSPPTSQIQLASPSTSQHPLDVPPPPDSDAIACICGFTYDDGFSIACDDCSRWCHAACFGIVQGGEVPEFWKCWVCDPTVEVDKERAVKIQKTRLKAMRTKASHGINGTVPGPSGVNGFGGNSPLEEGSSSMLKPGSKRKTSPGAERKAKRGSAVAAAIEGSGNKKKRRASMAPPDPSLLSPMGPPTSLSLGSSTQQHILQPGSSRIPHPNGNGTVTHSSQPTPVTFPSDLYPNPAVHAQLLRVAKAWRGVTALNPPSPLMHPPPKTYNDGGYTRVESQGYSDRYGYSMSPLDNTTPVILDENAGDLYLPRTVLRTDPPLPSAHSSYSSTYTLAHLRPPSPRLHVGPDPSPFSHSTTTISYPYPSPPISNYMSPTVPTPSHPRPYAKSPLTPSTNTVQSFQTSDTVPASTLLAPYTTTIVPSAAYLADPLNGYAHLGMGKPQVRLVGGGWGVGLDARGGDPSESESETRVNGSGVEGGKEEGRDVNVDVGVGGKRKGKGKGKWARCGCWPNAVVRPVICRGSKRGECKKGKGKEKEKRHKDGCSKEEEEEEGKDGVDAKDEPRSRPVNGDATYGSHSKTAYARHVDDASDQDQDDGASTSESDADPTTLSFALFALRDLRADEEIVLGWEWDDGHAVHMLPALMESPGMFGSAHLHHLRAQFTSILHALSSKFTTCACGSSTRDCAVRVMERVVEGRWPWPGGEMTPEGSEEESEGADASEEWEEGEGDVDVEGDGEGLRHQHQHQQRHRNRHRGLGLDVEVDVDIEMDGPVDVGGGERRVKKGKVKKKPKLREGDTGATASGSTGKKTIDLGPLVGVKRGFRTRERAPMSGGWCGVEVVPSSLGAFPQDGPEEEYRGKRKGKEKAVEVDGTGVADKVDMDVDSPATALPPRMRKTWPLRPTSESDPLQGDHLNPADSRGARGRWRSPLDTNADSPLSASSVAEGSHRRGVSVNMNGGGEDGADGHETEFDTETEADGVDDTRQMPPPPMPAALDPTTVSSLVHAQGFAGRSSSPVQREKEGVSTNWSPTRTSTSTSASSRSSQLVGPGTHPVTPSPPQTSSTRPQAQDSIPSSVGVLPEPSIPPQTPLVPSVSPSAPFSKLSIQSPDASTPISALFGGGDSSMYSPVSASSHQISHQRASSPPHPHAPHRPSKPLHVHPQNEPPSLPASLSASVVTINSSDSTRDTPAEAQYQQPYRSSPESRPVPEPDPELNVNANPVAASESPDMEKKRSVSGGEAYRVRFASPEVLSGLPRLRGREKAESPTTADIITGGMGDVKEEEIQDAATTDGGDAMDVDLAGSTAEESRMDHMDERTPVSSHSPPPLELPAVTPENESTPPFSEPQPFACETTTSSEPMAILPESTQPAREPSPPPPPKVKMSLKDFVLRKKKQREEEMAAKALLSPATLESSALPPSPSMDSKRDLGTSDNCTTAEQNGDPETLLNGHGHDVEMQEVPTAAAEEVLESRANVIEVKVDLDLAAHSGDGAVVGNVERPPKFMVEEEKAAPRVEVPSVSEVTAVSEPSKSSPRPPRSPRLLSPPTRVSDEVDGTDQTAMHFDMEDAVTLKAKVELMDAAVLVPNGSTPDDTVVAGNPSPLTNEAFERNRAKVTVPVSIPPLSLSTPVSTSASTSTSTSSVNSRATSIGVSVSAPSALSAPPHAHVPTPSSNMPSSRRPSHEDGEITSSTPPKTYLPRSHTPPTQPRSFHAIHPPSPNFGPTPVSSAPVPRRPAPPLSRSPLSNAAGPVPTPIASRPLPSGPRALRGSMSQPTHPPSYAPARPPYAGSQYIPRGPSADRERMDWDRDRQWGAAPSRSRGRAGSNGWGR